MINYLKCPSTGPFHRITVHVTFFNTFSVLLLCVFSYMLKFVKLLLTFVFVLLLVKTLLSILNFTVLHSDPC